MNKPTTLGELRRSEYWHVQPRSVKDEMRENLICRLKRSVPVFPGIVGYEDSVLPQVTNAILSRHNFILLGLRGQAKSRLLRGLAGLLEEEIPVVALAARSMTIPAGPSAAPAVRELKNWGTERR